MVRGGGRGGGGAVVVHKSTVHYPGVVVSYLVPVLYRTD